MARKGGMATGVEVARISVKVSPDTDKFRSDLKEELTKIEREVKGNVEVKAHLDRAQAQADFDRFMEKIKTEGAKGVKIKATVDQAGGKGSAGKSGGGKDGSAVEEASRLGKMLSRIKDKLTEAPNFGSGINITGYLVILTAIAAVAAPLAGLITGLLLTLPGLLSLILTPIAAITLGLDGMKKAAEVLKEPFDRLRETMNQAVESQFTPVFERLKAIFPTLSASMPAVSQGLADIANSMVGIATSSKGMASIQSIIEQIGSALSAAAPGFGSLTEALLGLTNTFTKGPLQGLVGWFNTTMESFNQWVMKAQASGQLETIFNRVGEALKIVMDALGKVAAIGIDVITDPAKWEVFVAILKGVAAAFVFIFQVSSSLLQTIALWVAAFRTAYAAVSEFLTNLPAIATSAWSSFVGFMVELWASIVLVVQQKIEQIKSFFSGIGQWFANGWAGLTEATSSAWESVKSAVSTAWENIKSTVSSAIGSVISTVSGWGSQIIGIITSIDLASAGRALVQRFIDGISAMAGAVVGAVKRVFGGITNLIPHSPAKEGPFASSGWNALFSGGEAVATQFGAGLENGFGPVIDQARDMAGKVAEAFANGGDPTAALGGYSTKDVSNMEKSLGLDSKRLGYQAKALEYQAKMAGKGALADSLKARAEEIKLQKEGLDLQKEMLSLTNDYNDANSGGKSSGNVFLDAINEFMKLPNGFLGATANQAMQDLNISGNGALQSVAGYGMDLVGKGVTNIFNTSNVADTLSLFSNQTNRQAQGIVGR